MRVVVDNGTWILLPHPDATEASAHEAWKWFKTSVTTQ